LLNAMQRKRIPCGKCEKIILNQNGELIVPPHKPFNSSVINGVRFIPHGITNIPTNNMVPQRVGKKRNNNTSRSKSNK